MIPVGDWDMSAACACLQAQLAVTHKHCPHERDTLNSTERLQVGHILPRHPRNPSTLVSSPAPTRVEPAQGQVVDDRVWGGARHVVLAVHAEEAGVEVVRVPVVCTRRGTTRQVQLGMWV